MIGMTLTGYGGVRLCGRLRPWDYALAGGLGLGLVWQIHSIAPYTKLYPNEMGQSRDEDNTNRISILVFNVLADNREVAALRGLIRDNDPGASVANEEPQPDASDEQEADEAITKGKQ